MTTEATTGISYWEGAIVVSGDLSGQSIGGRGYMELTGYMGQGLGSLIQ
jgi:predicted secreted hydrolase